MDLAEKQHLLSICSKLIRQKQFCISPINHPYQTDGQQTTPAAFHWSRITCARGNKTGDVCFGNSQLLPHVLRQGMKGDEDGLFLEMKHRWA